MVNAGIGLKLGTSGTQALTANVFDNLIAGNLTGIQLLDNGATVSLNAPFSIVNNTIADNTTGLINVASTPNVTQANVINNIFFSNHDLSTARTGTGISSSTMNTLNVVSNLFYGNGAKNLPANQASGTFGSFNPSTLKATPDTLGNLFADPLFVRAQDPRPNGDTPSVFFNFANYDLSDRSPAINTANQAAAPGTDILYRLAVPYSGHGFPGAGPASIGAYYYKGLSTNPGGVGTTFPGTGVTTTTGGATGGTTGAGGSGGIATLSSARPKATVVNSSIGGGIALGTKEFAVVNTSLSGNGTQHAADGLIGPASLAGPSFIDINFSDDIKVSTLTPNDLVLSGSGLDPIHPAKAAGFAWIDDHAVRFFLDGGYNNSGVVNVAIPQGALLETLGDALPASPTRS